MRPSHFTFFFFISLVLFATCKKTQAVDNCVSFVPPNHQTQLQILEQVYDTSFTVPDTVLAGNVITFQSKAVYPVSPKAVHWDIDRGGYTSSNSNVQLRFNNPGSYKIELLVAYNTFEPCDKRTSFTDTVVKILTVLPTDHNARLEGAYRGNLDNRNNEAFTLTLSYWRHPGDGSGRYYLRNYVSGCTGDYTDPQVPPGIGYAIFEGYKCFTLTNAYPCNASSDFRGHGYLNKNGDSLTINHFGYKTAQFVSGDTIPRWHQFIGIKQ